MGVEETVLTRGWELHHCVGVKSFREFDKREKEGS